MHPRGTHPRSVDSVRGFCLKNLYKDPQDRVRGPLVLHNLPPMQKCGAMAPRSGLTYIIVNKKTRLVLDGPVGEGGFVSVNRLSENDTQKARYSKPYHHLTL